MDLKTRTINSKSAITLNRAQVYNLKIGSKPSGLWYALGNAWLQWCKSEVPHWIGEFNYEVVLDSQCKLLILEDGRSLIEFTNEYGIKDRGSHFTVSLDWARLSKIGYDGIELPEYYRALRYEPDLLWYSAWDCSSGCIWNIGKVIELRKRLTPCRSEAEGGSLNGRTNSDFRP
jgi:hypothetical protein